MVVDAMRQDRQQQSVNGGVKTGQRGRAKPRQFAEARAVMQAQAKRLGRSLCVRSG